MDVKNILVPIDLTEVTDEPLRTGADLARHYGAKLHLLFALSPTLFIVPGGVFPQNVIDEMLEDSRSQLATLGAKFDDIEVLAAAEIGGPPHVIEEYSRSIPIDLVIMATHGRRGLARFFIGSTTEHVIRRVSCPVLTVRVAPKAETESEALVGTHEMT